MMLFMKNIYSYFMLTLIVNKNIFYKIAQNRIHNFHM